VRADAETQGQLLEQVATPDGEGRGLLAETAGRFKLSARGYHRVLRAACTLADLEASAGVRRLLGAEALSYRRIVAARS
jgi:magnesium chelatase family protein